MLHMYPNPHSKVQVWLPEVHIALRQRQQLQQSVPLLSFQAAALYAVHAVLQRVTAVQAC